MQLSEITGVKELKDKDVIELIRLLDDPKFKLQKLGHGVAGYVFQRGDAVYKFWAHDRAYELFVAFARAHPSPLFPKFLSRVKTIPAFMVKPTHFPDEIKYVKMERLEPLLGDHGIPGTPLKMWLNALKYISNHTDQIDINATYHENMEDLMNLIKHKWARAHKDPLTTAQVDVVWEFMAPIVKAHMDLMHLFGSNSLDLHSDNYMMRGDQLVITDPYQDEDDVNKNNELVQAIYHLRRRRENTDYPSWDEGGE